jgi:N utilization substance protein A
MVISAVEAALVSAYKRDTGAIGQNIAVRLDPNTGDVSLFQVKTVVEEIEDPARDILLSAAKREGPKLEPPVINPNIGDELLYELPQQVAGRIAAQTAKQVVIQRLREAERELVFTEFSERQGEVFTGTIQRSDSRYGGTVTLDLNGRAEGVLPPAEQSVYERYRPSLKIKVLILEVERTSRGPEIIVSRTHPDLLRRLFEMEVPEIYNGIVEIRGVAREAGSRSKVAVLAKQENVDPVGACIGLRGIRIQNIVNELQGEKIDVVQWSRDPATFISNALSPAQPLRVELDESTESAMVIVTDRSLSLAIGREGQNARLASKLTGWKVDIKSSTEIEIQRMKAAIEGQVAAQQSASIQQQDEKVEAKSGSMVIDSELPGADPIAEPASPVKGAESIKELSIGDPAPVESVRGDEEEFAALELEIAAEEAETVANKISAEEELALQLLKDAQVKVIEEVPNETLEVVAENADIWKVPGAIEESGIRFAEDILGAPVAGRTGSGRKRRKGPQRPTGNRSTSIGSRRSGPDEPESGESNP